MSDVREALKDLFGASGVSKKILKLVQMAMTHKAGTSTPEIEAILHGATGTSRPFISFVQYQRVIAFLKAKASDSESDVVYMNIQSHSKKSIRATITGDEQIREYCETDRLNEKTTYLEKMFVRVKGKDKAIERVDDPEVGYRVNLKKETNINSGELVIRELIRNWEQSRKTFRVIQRNSYHIGAFRIDCSRVRQADGKTLEESGVLESSVNYEVEIELVRSNIPTGMRDADVTRQFMKLIMRMLQIIRGTWFLMSNTSKMNALREYANLTKQSPPSFRGGRPYLPSFVGPMPITLENSMIPRIREGDYTVTQKADGERVFLMIDSRGNVSLVYRTMDIQSTGLVCNKPSVHKTILDGELVTKSHDGSPMRPMFLVFDCYMVNGNIMTSHPLTMRESITSSSSSAAAVAASSSSDDPITGDETTRLGEAQKVIEHLNTSGNTTIRWGESDTHTTTFAMKPFTFIPKIHDRDSRRIAEELITQFMGETNQYETDGLIFTPAFEPVSGYRGKDSLLNIRGTWSSVMKWKPPEDNTVDFLLKLSKTDDGISTSMGAGSVREGKLFVLGNTYTDDKLFDIQDAKKDDLRRIMRDSENVAVPFQAGANVIQLEMNSEGQILAKSGEIVYDNTIVECAWNPDLPSVADETPGGWVIRNVRWDKTATYQRSGDPRGTMNAERTAASVWTTAVVFPVTLDQIWGRDTVIDDEPDGGESKSSTGYFNRKGSRDDSLLARMTSFHNLVVKASLISPADVKHTRGDVFVDLACGQGGDIPRFQKTKAKFVFGLDIDSDNILNRERGAIMRYIERRKKMLTSRRDELVPMRFALADCGKDLFAKSEDLYAAIGTKSAEIIHRTLSKERLQADRVTCMFAFHYFFRDMATITTFFKNVTRLMRPMKDGVMPCFIACCFDGDKVEQLLLDKGTATRDGGATVSRYVTMDDGSKKLAWSIESKYDVKSSQDAYRTRTGSGSEGLGLRISVYIETINREHDEYIVRTEELTRRAGENGLRIATDEEANALGFKKGTGMFEELFEDVRRSKRKGIGNALEMKEYEKELSFLYRWFIIVPATV